MEFKIFSGKTVEEALENAAKELQVSVEEIKYTIISEKKTLFNKKIDISVYTRQDVIEFALNYLDDFFCNINLEHVIEYEDRPERLMVYINTENNALVIGKAGSNLRALNILLKNCLYHEFKEKIDVAVDINGYREQRYEKVISMAKRIAKTVQRTKTSAKLDMLPADERKVVHNALSEFPNIRTESFGNGKDRYLEIIYVEKKL